MGQSHDTHTHTNTIWGQVSGQQWVSRQRSDLCWRTNTHTHKDTHVHPIRSKQRARGKSFRVL